MATVNHSSISAGFIDYGKLQGGESKARVGEPSINIKDVGAVMQKAGAAAVASASMMGVPQLTEPAASSVQKAESVAYLTVKDAYDGSTLAVQDELAQTRQSLREEGLGSVARELSEIVNTALSQATVVSQSQRNKDVQLERQQDDLAFSIKDLEHRSGKSFQKILELLLSLFQSANQLRQFNIKLNDELVQSAASSQRREGGSILAGAISGAAFTAAVTAVGTAMQVKSANIKGNALANNKAKMDGLTPELQGAQGSLARQAQVKMGADHVDAVTQLPKKSPGVSNDGVAPANLPASPRNSGIGVPDGAGSDAVKLRPSDKQLSTKNQAVLDSVTSDLPADHAEEARQFQQNNLKADRMQAKGHAISNSAQSVGSIVRGSADYDATLERADQQILQANSRVASTAADDANENGRELRNLQQEMLRNMKEAQQSAMDAMGSSAGRI
ncbi:IpaC/SipC family type III secretion system effector [Burkholderia sp. DN3021]|uniref:IpaC/SipC family type III secretion system effector n=1 Tax=Burkholderia sp. DN3021 TaxID=3410137 RepID=UPI003C7B603A